MNNSNLSEMTLNSQNQMIDSTEYELDETALEAINGGDMSDWFSDVAGSVGEFVGDAVTTPIKSAISFGEGFVRGALD